MEVTRDYVKIADLESINGDHRVDISQNGNALAVHLLDESESSHQLAQVVCEKASDALVLNGTAPTEDAKILTKGYLANGAIVISTTITQSILNRVLHNNDSGSHESSDPSTLMMDMSFAHFNNKMVKGNWTDVDSAAKQIAVLLGSVAVAVGSDSCTYLAFRQEGSEIIGKATAIATVNALNYISAMTTAAVLGKKTYTKGDQSAQKSKVSLNCKRVASGVLVALTAVGASTANRLLISSNSSLGVVLNIACNEIVNKVFKTGQGAEKETANKVKLLAFYLLMSIGADILMGAVLPGGSGIWRYIGATSIGATLSFCKVSSKALLDHDIEKAKTEGASRCKIGAALVVATITPALVIAANRANFVKSSTSLSVGVKLIQHNVNSLAVRELFKNAKNFMQRSLVCLAPVALALGVEYLAAAINPIGTGLVVTGVAVATAASYFGMTVSGSLLRGDGDFDDG